MRDRTRISQFLSFNDRPGRAALAVAVLALLAAIPGEGQPAVGGPEIRANDDLTPPAVVARGERLYLRYCQTCHGGRSGEANHPYTPIHNHAGHTWHHSDQNLLTIIMDGITPTDERNRRVRGIPESVPRMPAWKGILSEDDAWAVLAFVKTWWLLEQRQAQARHSRATDQHLEDAGAETADGVPTGRADPASRPAPGTGKARWNALD